MSTPPSSEQYLEYQKRMSYPGTVRYEVGLFRNDEEVASAEGFFVHVYVDRQTRRPKPLNAPLRAALETIRA